MKLKVERKWKKATYTVGRLFVDGKLFSNTLEDKDRGLTQSMPTGKINQIKVKGETAIPTGTYAVAMNIVSPKFASVKWIKDFCEGKMPRLLGVKGFDGILLHNGSTAKDSAGCILVGKNTQVGKLTQSRETFKELYKLMKAAADNGEDITIEIV